jgi:hypothetical protein
MKDKYYTPGIEEFHVGFEYERINGTTWETAKINQHDFSSLLSYKDEENEFDEINKKIREVRVKYLDKEDIESLGFILKYDKNNHHTYHSGGYAITHCILDNKVDIYYMDGSEFVNGIVIKNLSELKIILKQLNIK